MGNQHMIPKITKPKWLTLNLCLGGVLSRLLPHCLCGLHAQGESMSRNVRLYKCSSDEQYKKKNKDKLSSLKGKVILEE